MKIGVMGDTHGTSECVYDGAEYLKSLGVDTILHVGDFGFWPGKSGAEYLSTVGNTLDFLEMNLYVVPGNHDDYDYINSLEDRGDGFHGVSERIAVVPRGHRWVWENVSFCGLGGAPSVDRQERFKVQRKYANPLWWAAEDITEAEVQKTIDGGHADVMITHDAPLGVPYIEQHISGNPFGFAPVDLEYARVGRVKMADAVTGVSPKLLIHGHYHVAYRDKWMDTDVFGLSSDGQPGNVGVLDLENLEVTDGTGDWEHYWRDRNGQS